MKSPMKRIAILILSVVLAGIQAVGMPGTAQALGGGVGASTGLERTRAVQGHAQDLGAAAVHQVRDLRPHRRPPPIVRPKVRKKSPLPAIIGGIIIGVIIAEAIREGRATEAAMDRCAARFRSFDRRTGTYITYGGEVRICPYLR
jgi:hypothetical protein